MCGFVGVLCCCCFVLCCCVFLLVFRRFFVSVIWLGMMCIHHVGERKEPCELRPYTIGVVFTLFRFYILEFICCV